MTDAITLIHVRFSNDGSVTDIGERPAELSPQSWFDRLSLAAGDAYQTLAGGRGLFRLAPARLDGLKTAATH